MRKPKVDAELFDALIDINSQTTNDSLMEGETESQNNLHNLAKQKGKDLARVLTVGANLATGIRDQKFDLITRESIFDEYLDHALKNNKIKFEKLTTRDSQIRAICRFDEEGKSPAAIDL